ncbi:GNAT family N-acetyltransferase [Curvivirga sp.]|uniref:GNAT family N-acetyltransferase n=1 Tax=Curvivirga sp. TaxID=2856848 RepID=UPI003B5B5C3C
MTITLQAENLTDKADITQLIDTCFGTDRKTRTVYQFRDGIDAYEQLCMTAKDENDNLVGSLRFWPVTLPNGETIPLFGPLAVKPDLQGQGLGRRLIQAGHDQVKAGGYPAMLIIGRPDYYKPFGYNEDVISNLQLPGPVAPLTFMGLEFKKGYLSKLSGLITAAR